MIASVLVIADDLTGANTAAAGVAGLGLRTLTIAQHAADQLAASARQADALIIDTASRHLSPVEAASRVRAALDRVPSARMVSKRIDSTLRGNIGAEVEAALAHLEARDQAPWRALVCPAYPDGGRVTVDGIQFVDGVALADSPVGRDVRQTLRSSQVADIFSGSTRSITRVGVAQITEGASRLASTLAKARGIVLCDALTHEHVRRLAQAAVHASAVDGPRWLAVDPSPLTVALVELLIPREPVPRNPVIVLAVSPTAATHRQLDRLETERNARFVQVDPHDADVTLLASMLADQLEASDGEPVGLRVATSAGGRSDHGAADELAATMAEALWRAARTGSPSGCYLTGGDGAAAAMAAFRADAIEVEGEVLPLAVLGRLVGGLFDGLPVVTKGGSVGDDQAAVMCVDALARCR